MRKSGYYRVRKADTWFIAQYFSGVDKWFLPGLDFPYYDMELEINETPINPEP